MSRNRCLLSAAALLAGSLMVSYGSMPDRAMAAEKAKTKPRIDLAFCIDTTGSMQNEIDSVKTKTKEIVAKLSGSKPSPDIRVGVVAYRDRGEEYVTKVFPFSDNIDQVVKDISSLKAQGGGDEPEAVNQALHASVSDLAWDKDKKTVKLLFLIGDAGPHEYPNDYSWETESKKAIAQGIQINTIACEGLTNTASSLDVFQKIARLADGKCEFLTYKQEIVNADGHRSTIVSSAGRRYEVKAPSADAWREGADKLMAKGVARAIAAPAAYNMAGGVGGGMAGAASESADFAALPSPVRAGALAKAMPVATRRVGVASYMPAAPSVNRAESNLADIVLSATKDAAKKKANIDYKD
jgi:Mg-chelatase subunit ChlD